MLKVLRLGWCLNPSTVSLATLQRMVGLGSESSIIRNSCSGHPNSLVAVSTTLVFYIDYPNSLHFMSSIHILYPAIPGTKISILLLPIRTHLYSSFNIHFLFPERSMYSPYNTTFHLALWGLCIEA